MSMYQPGIPTGSVNLDEDYLNIQQNFTQLDTSFGINHTAFSITANNGKHKFVEMPVGTLPAGLAASEATLYSKTANAASQLFFTPDASTNEYQLTRAISASFALFGANSNYGTPPAGFTQKGGWTFLPGGILFQYGFFGRAGASGTSGTIQFPVTFTNVPYSVQMQIYRNSSGNQVVQVNSNGGSTPTTANFQFLSSGASNDGFYWSAIGV